jgi:hypothetical protein
MALYLCWIFSIKTKKENSNTHTYILRKHLLRPRIIVLCRTTNSKGLSYILCYKNNVLYKLNKTSVLSEKYYSLTITSKIEYSLSLLTSDRFYSVSVRKFNR